MDGWVNLSAGQKRVKVGKIKALIQNFTLLLEYQFSCPPTPKLIHPPTAPHHHPHIHQEANEKIVEISKQLMNSTF